jgi:hypothetical protein
MLVVEYKCDLKIHSAEFLRRIPTAALGEGQNFLEVDYKRHFLRYEVPLSWPARDEINTKRVYDRTGGFKLPLYLIIIVTKQSEALKRSNFEDSSPEKF